jgi:hypothetical protein
MGELQTEGTPWGGNLHGLKLGKSLLRIKGLREREI